jgi:hypothetical protein
LSALKVKASGSSKMLAANTETAHCHNLEDNSLRK